MLNKKCTTCGIDQSNNNFTKAKKGKYGTGAECKTCMLIFRQSIYGVIYKAFYHQRELSKKRGYSLPTYTLNELQAWAEYQSNFLELYNTWVNSNYTKDLKPSFDRIHDYKSYHLNNLQILTYKQNKAKYYKDAILGNNTKNCKAVDKLDLQGNLITRYYSLQEAVRNTPNVTAGMISSVCTKKRKTSGGFQWKFSSIPNINEEII